MARRKKNKGIYRETLPDLKKTTRSIKAIPDFASRERSIDWSGMWQWLQNPDPVLRELGSDVSVYEEIESDSHLTAVIAQRKSGVTSLLWAIDRGTAKSRVSKLITRMFENLEITRIISEVLDDFKYGYSPLEIKWALDKESGIVFPLDVRGKPAEWFIFDAKNELKFLSSNAPTEGEELPPRKFLLSQHNGRYKNPYGEALLGRVFWPVSFKKGGLKFWTAFTERYGMPFAVGKVPRASDEAEYQKLADMLNDMIQDAVAVIPDDSTLEFVQSDVSGSSDTFEGLISFCNFEISKAIIGQTLTTEAGERGARSLGEVHIDVRADIIQEDKRRVERAFNTLIKWIVEINFGPNTEPPKFTMFEEEDVDLKMAERDKILSDFGTTKVEFSQDYIDRTYGFQKGDVVVSEKAETPAPAPNAEAEDEFAEGTENAKSSFKDQRAIDNMIDSITPEQWAEQSQFTTPIIEAAAEIAQLDKTDEEKFKLFQERILDNFDAVRPVELERILRNVLFSAEAFGQYTGEDL